MVTVSTPTVTVAHVGTLLGVMVYGGVLPTIVIEAMIFAALMGTFGGWLPARQAMRLSVVNALRRI